jgi:hypothetical protein
MEADGLPLCTAGQHTSLSNAYANLPGVPCMQHARNAAKARCILIACISSNAKGIMNKALF